MRRYVNTHAKNRSRCGEGLGREWRRKAARRARLLVASDTGVSISSRRAR